MYSYEDKVRAGAPYIQPDKRVKANIQQMAYPNINTLTGRCRENDPRYRHLTHDCTPDIPYRGA